MTKPQPSKPRGRKKFAVLSLILGSVLALAGMYFVISKIVKGWSEYGDKIRDATWGWTVLAVVLAFLGMSALGMVWRHVIAALGSIAKARDVFVWYQLGNLGKYVPGGVFQVLGRGELATRGGVPRAVAYNSVALSMGATYICGALVSGLLLPFALIAHGSISASWWVFLVIPFGFACLHPAVLNKVFTLAEKSFGGAAERQVPSWSESVILVVRHAPGWLINGLACYAVTLTFDPNPNFFTIMFAGIVSWVAGFMVIVVPSGLGVREAIFVALTQHSLDPATAGTVAIVSRLVFIVGDALGASIAAGMRSRMRTKRREAASYGAPSR